MNFADKLLQAIEGKDNTPIIVGLDSDFTKIPAYLKDEYKEKHGETFEGVAHCILDFNKQIIEVVKDIVPAVKLQMAFYEQYGQHGVWVFEETVKLAKQAGLVVVEDAKRNDIGNTAQAYADGHLGKVAVFDSRRESLGVDCITVNPYLGADSVRPFLDACKEHNKGIFVLVKTSNPGSVDLQDLKSGERKVYEIMADHTHNLGQDFIGSSGYSSVGAVVGATFPEEAKALRQRMPRTLFLVPGYGAQGGTAGLISHYFNQDGKGAIIHSARSIIFAYQKEEVDEQNFAEAARKATLQMKRDIKNAIGVNYNV